MEEVKLRNAISRKMMKLKNELIKKNGIIPSICYYYYLLNVVDYAGEDIVRESFSSLANQDAEVIVACYRPTDNTKKLCEEFGFKYLYVEDEPNISFAESKMRNKVIATTKANFVIPVNINVKYCEDLTEGIKSWIKRNDIKRHALCIRYKFQEPDGSIKDRMYGFSYVFYRPYLIHARGYDERTYYAAGSQRYGARLIKDIFELRPKVYVSNMFHKYHNNRKLVKFRLMYPDKTTQQLKRQAKRIVAKMIPELKADYFKNRHLVKNSYW